MQQPYPIVYGTSRFRRFRTNRSYCRTAGHYSLVAGAVGPAALGADGGGDDGYAGREDAAPPLSAAAAAYDPVVCAVLSNSISQEPLERISFERICNSIVKAKMTFRLIAVQFDPTAVPPARGGGGGTAGSGKKKRPSVAKKKNTEEPK